MYENLIVEFGIAYSNSPNSSATNLNGLFFNLRKSITRSKFFEPDLGDQLTAIVFLVDDRVWDREQWPDFSGGWYSNSVGTYPDPERYYQWKSRFSDDEEEIEKIIFLREFLPKLKLA